MDRAIPVSNKFCAKKWDEYRNGVLKKNIQNVKKTIDQAPPKCFKATHTQHNAKKEAILEQHHHEIDKANRKLLNKMSEIMSTKTYSVGPKLPAYAPSVRDISLHKSANKSRLEKINEENKKMLERLQRVQPQIDRNEWSAHARESYKRFKNACEYPDKLRLDESSFQRTRPSTHASGTRLVSQGGVEANGTRSTVHFRQSFLPEINKSAVEIEDPNFPSCLNSSAELPDGRFVAVSVTEVPSGAGRDGVSDRHNILMRIVMESGEDGFEADPLLVPLELLKNNFESLEHVVQCLDLKNSQIEIRFPNRTIQHGSPSRYTSKEAVREVRVQF